MSVNWIRQILNARKHLDLKGDELFGALMIASYANKETGECRPKLETIAKDMDCSVRTVQRVIAKLDRVFDITDGFGRGRSSEFSLALKAKKDEKKHDTDVMFSAEKTRQTRTENTTSADGKHDKSGDAYKEEPNKRTLIREPERGTRIPDPFLLTVEMRSYAADKRPNIDVNEETEKFVNYWRSKPGSGARKLDWVATWRNWILNAKGGSSGKAISTSERNMERLDGTLKLGQQLAHSDDALAGLYASITLARPESPTVGQLAAGDGTGGSNSGGDVGRDPIRDNTA